MVRASPADAASRPTVTFPDGAVIPDWGSTKTPTAREALSAIFEAFIGPKWPGMDEAEDQVRRAVLRAYADSGRAPATAEIGAAGSLAPDEVASALRRLAGRDLVVLDGVGQVTGAYPFTDASSEHRVEVGGVTMSAMCAIDALGIGAMLRRDAVVRSLCRHCGRPLTIRTRGGGGELEAVEPAGVVVWSGDRYADGCAASSLCTLQACFCDDDHLAAWRAGRPVSAQGGVRLRLPEALEVGRAIFAPMRPWPSTT